MLAMELFGWAMAAPEEVIGENSRVVEAAGN